MKQLDLIQDWTLVGSAATPSAPSQISISVTQADSKWGEKKKQLSTRNPVPLTLETRSPKLSKLQCSSVPPSHAPLWYEHTDGGLKLAAESGANYLLRMEAGVIKHRLMWYDYENQ